MLISQMIRSVEFTHLERKRLIEKTRNLVETVRPLEREVSRLDKRLEGARGDAAKEIRKEFRQNRDRLAQIAARLFLLDAGIR